MISHLSTSLFKRQYLYDSPCYCNIVIFNLIVEKLGIMSSAGARNSPRNAAPGGGKVCQFKLVLLGKQLCAKLTVELSCVWY